MNKFVRYNPTSQLFKASHQFINSRLLRSLTYQKQYDMLGSGEITVIKFVKNRNPNNKIHFYIANWTSVTQPAKDALYAFDSTLNGSETSLERTYLADLAKRQYFMEIFADMALYKQENYRDAIQHTVIGALDKIIIDGFVDVMLSLGKGDFLEKISNTTTKAMEIIIKHDTLKPNAKNIFLVSGSLGSKVLYDHITQTMLNANGQDRVAKIFRRKKTLLMTPTLLKLFNMNEAPNYASQAYMIRFDKAHDNVGVNPRVLEVMAFGVPKN